jgi:hypothetical protein
MKKWFPDPNEFYVGYIPKAPATIASIIRKIIFAISFVIIVVASMLAWQQKKFSPANFEYGVNTTLEGYIFNKPVPHILIPFGNDIQGKELYQTTLLVGFGKSGADKFTQALGITKNQEGSKVRLTGSLIYGDGKTLLQIDENSKLTFLEGSTPTVSTPYEEENLSLSGEIVDPKCYFGVMKPGEGKAHRSCAIRCIAGGIPPVFKTDSSGYFLLLNENGEPISSEIAALVGDHVTLTGKAMRWNDWTILSVDSQMIQQLSATKKWKENLIAFEENMTKCN